MKHALIIVGLALLAGCGSTSSTAIKLDAATLLALVPQATGPACTALAGALRPAENQQVCTDLSPCLMAFCAMAPTPAAAAK